MVKPSYVKDAKVGGESWRSLLGGAGPKTWRRSWFMRVKSCGIGGEEGREEMVLDLKTRKEAEGKV